MSTKETPITSVRGESFDIVQESPVEPRVPPTFSNSSDCKSPSTSSGRTGARNQRAKRVAGFTLIELIIFIVIISVGLAGVLLIFDTVTRHSADPIRAKQALAVAEGMMDEILANNFCDPTTANFTTTPTTCVGNANEGSRDLYDSVDDYHGYFRAGIRDITNDATILLPEYDIRVAVTSPASFVVGTDTMLTNFRLVTVTVTDTFANQNYVLTAYKFNND